MNGRHRNIQQLWIRVGLVVCLAMVLIAVVAGCTRSKSGGLPTAEPAATTTISVVDVVASPTVISAVEETPTTGMEAPSPTTTTSEALPTSPPPPTDTPPSPGALTYTVLVGDTLYSIALSHNVTVDEIMALNGITDLASISVGQVLTIRRGQAPSVTVTPVSTEEVVHVVQKGENLYRIALQYGTTVQAIVDRNKIVNPSRVWVGQKLIIPSGGEPPLPSGKIHVVQPGENLYRIALRYGTTPWAIAVANGLSSTQYIYVGQRLRIP